MEGCCEVLAPRYDIKPDPTVTRILVFVLLQGLSAELRNHARLQLSHARQRLAPDSPMYARRAGQGLALHVEAPGRRRKGVPRSLQQRRDHRYVVG